LKSPFRGLEMMEMANFLLYQHPAGLGGFAP